MPNELGFTVTVPVSRISDTSALVGVIINDLPANITINGLVICRAALDTPDQIDTLVLQQFPSMSEFPLSYIDDGTVIIPGGGGATTIKLIDPTKTYVYSAGITTQPLVVQEWGQGTLAPVSAAAAVLSASKKKKH